MRSLFAIGCFLLGCCSLLPAGVETLATGPFTEADYVILSLSQSQLEEVESKRRLTLSKAQLQELRALAPAFPKRIGVASPFVNQIADSRFSLWPDQVAGVWFCKDRVAIARNLVQGSEGCREFSMKLNPNDAVLIDSGGGYWIGPRPVDRDGLIESLDQLAIRAPAGTAFEIFILRPPVLEQRDEEQAVQQAVEDLAALCGQRGLGCRVGG